jgi:hypothetical protein
MKLQLRNLSSWTIFIFGFMAAVLGLLGLIRPEWTLGLMNLPAIERAARPAGDYTLMFITASSMASLNVGIYYVLAALSNWKAFYGWTVPFRMLTFTVFTLAVVNGIAPAGFLAVAVWELIGALLTGAALLRERGQV